MKIAIIYNLPENYSHSKDTLADEEAFYTSKAIKKILENKNQVDLIRVTPENLGKLESYDIVFNLAENTEGCPLSESEITEFMEKNNIVFTGAGSKALRNCVDKAFTKEIMISHDIMTPKFQVFKDSSDLLSNDLNFPLIVKPAMEDASVGINEDSYVKDKNELKLKVKNLLNRYNQPVLVEEYIDGQEINAAVLSDEILPLSEIVFELPEDKPKILTYESKWDTESKNYMETMGRCPAHVERNTEEKINLIAIEAVKLMGCRDYARVDFRLKNNVPYLLEVNPNPCINPEGTGFLRSANAAGYEYADVIKKIIDSAIERKNLKK